MAGRLQFPMGMVLRLGRRTGDHSGLNGGDRPRGAQVRPPVGRAGAAVFYKTAIYFTPPPPMPPGKFVIFPVPS